MKKIKAKRKEKVP